MDSRTVLVGELMLGLMKDHVSDIVEKYYNPNMLKTMMMTVLKRKVMHIRTGIRMPYIGCTTSRGPSQEDALTK